MNKTYQHSTPNYSFIKTAEFANIVKACLSATIILVILVNMFWRFFFPENGYLSYFTDDFFYYLKVAENINLSNLSSFNGIHLTNGYHPLWLLILVGILKITGTSNIFFFLLLSLIISILNILVYILSLQICAHFLTKRTLCYFIASITTLFCIEITRSGMEVALTIPVLLIILKYIINNKKVFSDPKKIFFLAFLCSILVLSRLDSFIFVLILLARLLDYKSYKTTVKNFLVFGFGGILVPLYLIFNLTFFDTIAPVSGQVKHLKNDLLPSFNAIISFLKLWPQRIFIVTALLISFHCMTIFLKEKLYRKSEFFPLFASIIFVYLYILTLSFSSNWDVWIWYCYPFVPLVLSSSIVLIIYFNKTTNNFTFSREKRVLILLLVLFTIYGYLSSSKYILSSNPSNNIIYSAALKIAEFEKTHKGIYGMGDRAGTPGYLLKSPLIQLEGLVMDKDYLENIKASRNLIDVLTEYNVDYYIATNPKRNNDNYTFVEPVQSRSNCPKMLGQLSTKPIYEFTLKNVNTVIFDLKNIK